ncbi:glycosyltransferase [Actinokineospora diospyrosa]|uniref:Galactofuranosylgalactofuranosylrhamnosyl-N-acetylglucosaminyl-diphospho-decaprenol beta-1,5/1,6-galactofuranosyltransferase n=1 Tax=Actinokineospora diospyrosa TaxID=103728 RepID=A0ABT1ID38_9PSEU|nr:glycosyltransferase [Actinokineospora diospyrosa]MCP2270552.1 galactofuranosylgalactofuranosylrhamnosyl-N-acetylglucosaminyl-diphospho-decaprenol beta-1,5/1,6-galactofuranosyltransferase [Actinokineospora diospyrosa]
MTEQGKTNRTGAHAVLQRVILPRGTDPVDVRPLYLDEPDAIHSLVSARTKVTIPGSARVSFASYFNAFPASYWKRWTRVSEVVLRLSARGAGRVDVYRSKPNGDQVHLTGQAVRTEGDEPAQVEFRISLAPFEDGGWIWFDVFTEDSPLEISDAAWTTDLQLPPTRLSIGTTTFNRVDDCVNSLLALGEDPVVLDALTKVYVADQGTQKISSHPRFTEAAALLGDRLEVIEQGNLGGSGGFSRAFFETIEHSDVDQIMLMDDDISLEPDSILRASMFARAATAPVIVGSQMLNLQAKARLHSMGEVVDLSSFTWRAAPGALTDHDFGLKSLRETKKLHRRIDATYNGWWMCLFPREIIKATGLPLPLFIKWDDAEYSLRALEKGYPTVTLPGSGVWHMPWTDKNDASDWTAYFHLRNRLIVAALHTPHDHRKVLLKQGLRVTIRRLLSMEYSTVAIELKAIEDFLAGPDRLFDLLPTVLPEVQRIRKQYADAQTLPSASEFPPPTLDAVHAERMLRPPVNPAKIAAQAAQALLHNLRPPAPESADRPQVNVPAGSALWFLLGNLDSATVSNPDGSGVAFRKRDPETFRELAKQATGAYRRLAAEWPTAKDTWRAALPELTSVESWRKVFES